MKPFFPYLVRTVNKRRKAELSSKAPAKPDNSDNTPDTQKLLEDVMLSQLKIAKIYNDCCLCCVDENLRTDLLNILRDNYEIYNQQFDEAKKRGWVSERPVNEDAIETVKAKFSVQN